MSAVKEMFYKHMSPSKLISKFEYIGDPKENQENLENEIPFEMINLPAKPVSILKESGSPTSSYASCKSSLTKSVRFSDESSPCESDDDVFHQATVTQKCGPMVPKKLNINCANLNGIQKARHLLRSVSPKMPTIDTPRRLQNRKEHELIRKRLFHRDSDSSGDPSSDSTQPNSPATVSLSLWELDVHVSMSPSTPLTPIDAFPPLDDRVSLAENRITVATPPPRYVYIPSRPHSPLSLLDRKRIPESILSNECCSLKNSAEVGFVSNIDDGPEVSLKGDSQVLQVSNDDETSTEEDELWIQKLSNRRFRRSARSKRVHFPSAEVFAEEYSKEFGDEETSINGLQLN